MNALIADANRIDSKSIMTCLKSIHCSSQVSFTIEEATLKAKTNPFDLIISETLLPDGDGYQFCQSLRTAKINIPFFFVSTRDSTKSKLKGFEAGADDYLTKPFHEEELLARIKALTKRGPSINPITLTHKSLALNSDAHRVYVGDHEVALSSTPYEVLKYFLEHQDELITREELIEKVWGEDPVNIVSNTVDTHIKLLRQIVGRRLRDQDFIKTIWGKGYRIDREVL